MNERAKGKGKEAEARRKAVSTSIFCLFAFALLSCGVDERRSLPPGAQETIERVTEDIAAGRDEKVYAEAAEEWRASVSAEENKRLLSQARERLGRVSSRALHSGRQQQPPTPTQPRNGETGSNSTRPAHRLVVTYQTTFERGTAMETFTLLERDGNWQLAGYSVSSDALKQ